MKGKLALCVTNEIIEEYLEIIEQKTNANIASNVVSVILSQKNVEFVTPYYKLHLIHFGMLTTLSLEMSNESFFLWFLALSVLKFGHLISLCMNKIYNSIKEACLYVGIVALACGSALVLLIKGNKRKC